MPYHTIPYHTIHTCMYIYIYIHINIYILYIYTYHGFIGHPNLVGDQGFMKSVEKNVLARVDQWKPKSIEFDLPQILLAFVKLKVKGGAKNKTGSRCV